MNKSFIFFKKNNHRITPETKPQLLFYHFLKESQLY